MATCEDAPCCGCCGTSLYGSEVVDYYDGSDYQESFYDRGFEPEVDPEDCDHDGTETRDGTNWFCSWCDTPVPAPEGEFVWAF